MVDSRAKGQRAEYSIRDKLRDKTGFMWERVPGSGAFGQGHGLKGDVYLPPATGNMSKYCFEVKHYKEEQLHSNVLNTGVSQLEKWWDQTTREANQMNMKPALVFKKDKGDWLIALSSNDPTLSILTDVVSSYISICKRDMDIVIGKFDVWLHHVDLGELVK